MELSGDKERHVLDDKGSAIIMNIPVKEEVII
jgi:hypothetical protein